MFNWYAVLDNAKQRIAELENGDLHCQGGAAEGRE